VKNLELRIYSTSAIRSYGRLAGWLADKIVLNLEIFKIMYQDEIFDFLLCLTKLQCYCSHTNVAILFDFLCKDYSKVDFGHTEILDVIFSS